MSTQDVLTQVGRAAVIASMAVTTLAAGPLIGRALAAAPVAGTGAPTCDQLHGSTMAQSAKWRVFRTAGLQPLDGPDPIRACRRSDAPATRVLRLAADGCSEDGNHCKQTLPRGLEGDRLLVGVVEERFEREIQHRVFDLDARRVADVGPLVTSEIADVNYRQMNWAHLTPDGGVVIVDQKAQSQYGEPYEPGGYWVFDRDGARYTRAEVTAMAPSRGSRTAAPGAYFVNAIGTVWRVVPNGPARLRWERGPKLVPAPHEPQPRYAVARRTLSGAVGLESEYAGPIDLVQRRTPASKAGRWLESTDSGERTRFAELAPTGMPRVVAFNAFGALVKGRFADRPGRVRVRLQVTDRNGRARVDLPAASVPNTPGLTAVTFLNALAIAGRDGLQVWDPAPRTLPVAGGHDLAPSGDDGLFFTDAGGDARLIRLGDANRPDGP